RRSPTAALQGGEHLRNGPAIQRRLVTACHVAERAVRLVGGLYALQLVLRRAAEHASDPRAQQIPDAIAEGGAEGAREIRADRAEGHTAHKSAHPGFHLAVDDVHYRAERCDSRPDPRNRGAERAD